MEDKIPYNKPFLDYKAQLEQLRNRGLIIENEDKALHLLEKVSYYRLSGYWYPLLADAENHIFKEGASFEIAFKLYCFDKDLRKLFLSEIEKIEVSVRSQIIHVLASYFGAFWIEDEALFPNHAGYVEIRRNIDKEYGRSDERFIDAFRDKYSNHLPPCWMLLEVTSFGTLSMIYKHLKPGRSKREIAGNFGLSDSTFESWLHSIVYVRNICAHHSRLWNRVFNIRPLKLLNPQYQWLENKEVNNSRVFYFASTIVYLLNIINPKHCFKEKFISLLKSNQNLDYNRMGFPDGWQNEPLWK